MVSRRRTSTNGQPRGLTAVVLLIGAAQVATACNGEPRIEYSAQPPQLATFADTALRVGIHDEGCVLIHYPRQQGGGVVVGHIDDTTLATFEGHLAKATQDVVTGEDGDLSIATAEANRMTLDGDLLTLRWRDAGRTRHLAWRHGDPQQGKRGGRDLAGLRDALEALAEQLRPAAAIPN